MRLSDYDGLENNWYLILSEAAFEFKKTIFPPIIYLCPREHLAFKISNAVFITRMSTYFYVHKQKGYVRDTVLFP